MKPIEIPRINAERGLAIPTIQIIPAQGLHLKKNQDDYINDFYGLKNEEGVNIETLLDYIRNPNRPKLNYANYIKKIIYRDYQVIGQDGVIEVERTVNKTIPFTYINKYKQKIITSINCGINKRLDYIENVPYPSLDVDYKSKSIRASLNFFYVNTEKYRRDLIITSSPSDFLINEKYIGIKFFSDNLSDMASLVSYIQKNDAAWYREYINNNYVPKLENCDEIKELLWLYENAPDFTLEELKQETLWKHIRIFYNYDTKGTLSFLKDASPMLMKALFAFNTREKISFLMKKINENQDFIISLYHALDDEIVYMGTKVPCKTALISAITAFSTISYESFNFTDEFFTIGKKHRVILEKNEDNSFNKAPKYTVTQKTKISTSFSPNIGTGAGGVAYDIYNTEYSSLLSPLDIIFVIQDDVKSLFCVPLLFLYDEQYQRELEGTMTLVRLGIDMLAIALAIETGGASLLASEASASMTFFGILAAVDGAIALGDIGVQLNKDKLTKEFLEKWEKIYHYGGTATASPLIVANLYKLGGKILTSASKIETKNFVRSCLMKLILESEIFRFNKNTLRLAGQEDVKRISGNIFDATSFKYFWEQGCQLAYGELRVGGSAADEIALVYKGVPILEGTAQELRPELLALYNARYNKSSIENLLENLYKLTPKLTENKKFWTCFNKAGTELIWSKLGNKNMQNSIESALINSNLGKQWEGEVAKEIGKYDEITEFSNKFQVIVNGNKEKIAGDIDVANSKYMIECKESLSHNTLTTRESDGTYKFLNQFEKYTDNLNPDYINIRNKKVVLAVKNFGPGVTTDHPILKQLIDKGVIIITDLQQIKNLK